MGNQVTINAYQINGMDALSFFYTKEYLDYEAVSSDAHNRSSVFEYNGTILIAPAIENDFKWGGDKFSFIPLPCFRNNGSGKSKKVLLEYYFENLMQENKKIFLRKDPLVIYDDSVEKAFLEQGFDVSVVYTTIVDLTEDNSLLWLKVRKSYKSLINKVNKNFSIQFFNYYDHVDFFEDWKQLYNTVTARGNAIPSAELWHQMENMFQNKKTFFAGIYDGHDLISCIELGVHNKNIYYLHSATHPEHEGAYSFTHALLWASMKKFKKIGYEKMEIGPVFFRGLSSHHPSEKELAISNFKLGMGGKITPFLLFSKDADEKN